MSEDHFRLDAASSHAARRLEAVRSLDGVVAILRETARQVVHADGISVVLREGGSCFYAAEDAIEPLWRGRRFPLESCVSGWAMLHDETVVVPDIEADPRVPVVAYRSTSIRSLIMVPVGSPTPVAALGAYWCTAVLLDAATVARLEALAQHAAVALARIGIGSGRAGD